MIEDKTLTPTHTPRDWAVFRYGLISEATRPLAGEVVSDILSRVAARQHTLPDGSIRRFSVATLRGWLHTYQREGLDGLATKTRSDKGSFRVLDDDTAEIIARFRVQHRALSVKLFHEVLLQDAVLPQGVSVRLGTLRRSLKSRAKFGCTISLLRHSCAGACKHWRKPMPLRLFRIWALGNAFSQYQEYSNGQHRNGMIPISAAGHVSR